MQTITIPRRFRGPPNSGNGGYVCGMLARQIAGADLPAASRSRTASPPNPAPASKRWRGIDVSGLITRVLTATGLKK